MRACCAGLPLRASWFSHGSYLGSPGSRFAGYIPPATMLRSVLLPDYSLRPPACLVHPHQTTTAAMPAAGSLPAAPLLVTACLTANCTVLTCTAAVHAWVLACYACLLVGFFPLLPGCVMPLAGLRMRFLVLPGCCACVYAPAFAAAAALPPCCPQFGLDVHLCRTCTLLPRLPPAAGLLPCWVGYSSRFYYAAFHTCPQLLPCLPCPYQCRRFAVPATFTGSLPACTVTRRVLPRRCPFPACHCRSCSSRSRLCLHFALRYTLPLLDCAGCLPSRLDALRVDCG